MEKATGDGSPLIDPTKNVLDLVAADARRQDELAAQESKHFRELLAERDKLFDLRAQDAREIREAESNRIDAIRAVDVETGNKAAVVASAQITALAASTTVLADTLRAQVAVAATASDIALKAALTPIQNDVAELRRVQYQQQGERASRTESKDSTQWSTSTIISLFAVITAIAALALTFAKAVHP